MFVDNVMGAPLADEEVGVTTHRAGRGGTLLDQFGTVLVIDCNTRKSHSIMGGKSDLIFLDNLESLF